MERAAAPGGSGYSDIDIKGTAGWIVGDSDQFLQFNGSSWTPIIEYPSQRLYYWRVAMVDLGNFTGPYNEATILLGGNLIFLPTMKKHRP